MKKYVGSIIMLSLVFSLIAGCNRTDEEVKNDVDDAYNKEEEYQNDMKDDVITDENQNGMLDDDLSNGLADDYQTQSIYQDGTYRAEAKDYDNMYKHYVEITVKEGKLEKVMFDGLDESGSLRSGDTTLIDEYMQKFEKSIADIMTGYSDKLVETQTIEMVDVINGSDDDHRVFEKLVNAALMNAQTGEKTVAIVDTNM